MHRSCLPCDQLNGHSAPYSTDMTTVPDNGVKRTSVAQPSRGPPPSSTTVPSSSGEPTSTDQPGRASAVADRLGSRPRRIMFTTNEPLVGPRARIGRLLAGQGRERRREAHPRSARTRSRSWSGRPTEALPAGLDGPPGTGVRLGSGAVEVRRGPAREARGGRVAGGPEQGEARSPGSAGGKGRPSGEARSPAHPSRTLPNPPETRRPPSRPSATAVSGRWIRSPDPSAGRHRSSRPIAAQSPRAPRPERYVVQRRPAACAASAAGSRPRIRISARPTMNPVRRAAARMREESRFMAVVDAGRRLVCFVEIGANFGGWPGRTSGSARASAGSARSPA